MRKSALFGFGLVVTMLVALGLVVLSSASEVNGVRLHHDIYFFMKRQFAYLGMGVLVAAGIAWFDYRNWRNHPGLTVLAALAVLALLCLVFKFTPTNGSHRWIKLGPVNLQPSEFAKLITVILVSVMLDLAGWRVELFRRGALYPALVIGLIALPILLEPDFGSVMVVASAGFLLMFVAGSRLLHIAPFCLAGLGVFVVKVAMNDNRMARIMAFFGSSGDGKSVKLDAAAQNASYQVDQALIAIKSGGIWGVGLRESMQKHAYLPEAHTDFIFAVGAEELGIFFSIAVVLLFTAFLVYAVYIARHAADRFGRLLVIGMTFIIFFQAMFNLGVVCEALPTKGMALPFFSYGGTNLICAFVAVGTILSVGIHSYRDAKRKVNRNVFVGSHG